MDPIFIVLGFAVFVMVPLVLAADILSRRLVKLCKALEE